MEHKNGMTMDRVPFGQLVKLQAPMRGVRAGTIGYTIDGNKFVVVAGATLRAVNVCFDTPVEILKLGILTLEIE